MYPRLTVIFFKFSFIHETFFARVFARSGEKFTRFCFCFIVELSSQPRIYADLLRLQSRVKDPKGIIILMKIIIPFFIYSFHVLTLAHEQERSKNSL